MSSVDSDEQHHSPAAAAEDAVLASAGVTGAAFQVSEALATQATEPAADDAAEAAGCSILATDADDMQQQDAGSAGGTDGAEAAAAGSEAAPAARDVAADVAMPHADVAVNAPVEQGAAGLDTPDALTQRGVVAPSDADGALDEANAEPEDAAVEPSQAYTTSEDPDMAEGTKAAARQPDVAPRDADAGSEQADVMQPNADAAGGTEAATFDTVPTHEQLEPSAEDASEQGGTQAVAEAAGVLQEIVDVIATSLGGVEGACAAQCNAVVAAAAPAVETEGTAADPAAATVAADAVPDLSQQGQGPDAFAGGNINSEGTEQQGDAIFVDAVTGPAGGFYSGKHQGEFVEQYDACAAAGVLTSSSPVGAAHNDAVMSAAATVGILAVDDQVALCIGDQQDQFVATMAAAFGDHADGSKDDAVAEWPANM